MSEFANGGPVGSDARCVVGAGEIVAPIRAWCFFCQTPIDTPYVPGELLACEGCAVELGLLDDEDGS